MGRTGKATSTTIKVQPGNDTKQCVSEDTISKLMKEFTCASLLTKVAQSATPDQRSSFREAHAECCEGIVSSLKHFHLKTPVNKRTRLKEKKNFQRRSKSFLENKFNLSVAATNSQTSVVWPGKLNCLSTKKTESNPNVIIRPSKLSIPGITDKQLCSSSLSSPIHTSTSEEKARIAVTLSSQDSHGFDGLNGKNNTTLSFSKLCNRTSKVARNISPSSSLPASIKNQTYRSCLPASKSNNSVDHNQSCSSSDFQGVNQNTSDKNKIAQYSSHQQQHTGNTFSLSHVAPTDDVNNNILNHTTNSSSPPITNQSSTLSSASACSIAPERSCSEEMRMEESNVNELASYFEDLLHIPRKMSVMAEMMYA